MAPAPVLTGASMSSALGGASLAREQNWAEPGFYAPCLRPTSNWCSSSASIHSGAENALQHATSQTQLCKSRGPATGARLGQVPAARARANGQNAPGQGIRSRSSNALNDITNLNQPGAAKAKKERNSAKPGRQPLPQTCIDDSSEQGHRSASTILCPTTPSSERSHDVQCCADYAPEIFARMFREEMLYLPLSNYMEQQTDINAKMRAILIDWLIEVAMKYRLRPETLFLTVNIIDRYLSQVKVVRKKLQLLGVVAMFIASKFEEIDPPRVTDFVYITDNTYTKEDIFQWECQVLATLEFRIVVPTPAHFLDELLQANRCEACHAELAKYILELALLDYRLISYTSSHLVAAALLLSNILIARRPVWPATMLQSTRHAEHVLQACVEDMRSNFESAATAQLQAVRKKYSLPQHRRVAQMDFSTSPAWEN